MTRRLLSRALFSGALVLGGLTVTSAASSQGVDEFGSYGYSKDGSRSSQNWAIELRFGRYLPKIDEEFSENNLSPVSGAPATEVFSEGQLNAPQDTFFGESSRYWLGFELDWQALRIPYFGTLGPGFGMGFTQQDAANFDEDLNKAKFETSISILPMYAVGVLRVDVLARKTPIPLVPFGKLGLGTALWWTDDGGRLARDEEGTKGKGSSSGWQWAAGVMLLLDVLEPAAANNMDATSGINNSYLFIEWYDSYLDNFGGKALYVGNRSWTAGIALEF